MPEATLKRSIGLPLLTLYGLGTILGVGIYVLIGEVAGEAGRAAPSAFVLAAVLAGITAFSYAELASRLPQSAGEATYVAAAFARRTLTAAVGWAVILIGIVSAATMSHGFAGYFALFFAWPPALVITMAVTGLGALAAWGISQSTLAAAAVTVVEIAGLVIVCVVARDAFADLPTQWPTLLPDLETASLLGVVAGAFVAFYAFIGFEDMVNVAEEVQQPTATLPRAIVLALSMSTALYFLVAAVAVLSLSPASLAASDAPLASIVAARGVAPESIALISLLAVMNGGLVQIIMASRVLYGLAGQGLVWAPLGRVHPVTRTPLYGTAAITVVIVALALSFSLGELARLTSLLTLIVFALVNAALLKLKRQRAERPPFSVPLAVPVAGCVLCGGLVCYQAAAYLLF